MTTPVATVMLLAVALLFCSVRLPVPVVPPEIVNKAVPVSATKVVPALLTVTAPETVNGEAVLL